MRSLLLALAPADVRKERFEPGAAGTIAELLPRLRAGGVASVSANGVLGDPRPATAEAGHRLLTQLARSLAAAVAAWATTLPAA